MENLNDRRSVMFGSVTEFGRLNLLVPALPRATVLYGTIAAAETTIRTLGGSQVAGFGGVRSAVSEAITLRDELLEDLRKLNRIARALPVADFPGVREKFRMPVKYTYQGIADSARAFIGNAGPITQIFIDRGRPATFVDDLESVLAAYEAARLRKQVGRHAHIGSTAGIEIAGREGVAAVRELDSILSPLYEDDPVRYAAWKAAIQIRRAPVAAAPPAAPLAAPVPQG